MAQASQGTETSQLLNLYLRLHATGDSRLKRLYWRFIQSKQERRLSRSLGNRK